MKKLLTAFLVVISMSAVAQKTTTLSSAKLTLSESFKLKTATITDIQVGLDTNYNSNSKIPSSLSIKTFVEGRLANLELEGGGGGISSITVASSNGFSGSSSGGLTPTLTIGTSLTGMLKGNGTGLVAATAGTDYLAPNGSAAALTSFPTFNQNTTGSAASLTTPRNINGVAFNGTADITVAADANTLTGTVLKSTIVSSSLTSVGTLNGLTATGTVVLPSTTSIGSISSGELGFLDGVTSNIQDQINGLIAGGGGDMLLSASQTITGNKIFSHNTLKLAGSTSGAITLVSPAAAGSGTVILPFTGVLATTNGTEVFTNKDLSSGTNILPSTITASLVGNASTATNLQVGRTIGITGDVTYTSPSFNGSSNVTSTAVVTRINGVSLAGLTTGLLKNTTGTGEPVIAVPGTDYLLPNGSGAGLTGVVLTGGSYTNPSWLVSLPWSKITSTPTTLAGYGITDGGTVNTGNINRLTYYSANGTTVSALPALTVNRAMITDANGLPFASTVTATELSYLQGASSNLQDQINAIVISGGGGDMLLGSVQTNTGVKTFNTNTFKLAGSTSGSITLNAPATAGTGTVVLPLSGTLATIGGTETFTNKDLTAVSNIFPTFNQNTTGSAASLTTARTINGVSFNGTANITITAASNTLTGTALASNVVTSSLTTLGTIATGVWQGTVITGAFGGTGVANTGKTITLGGNLVTSGAFSTTLISTANTSITLPTSGTLATVAGTETFTNKNFTSGTNVFPTFNQNTTGSAASLTTARNINGVAFNGTADITIGIGAASITGTTLASNVVSSSLTSVGTLNGLTVTGTVALPTTTSIGVVSSTELSYLDGLTGNIQTQLNAATTTTTAYTIITATGGQTAFTFSSVPASMNDYMIYRNGVLLEPTNDYTTSGNIVTLTFGAIVGDKIRYQRVK